jgi:hypothetical protein
LAQEEIDVRVISIGTLAAHPLWGERAGGAARNGHCTCTLVRAGGRVILVDPSLPPQAIVTRLDERSGLKPSDVTHVFLTSFKPETRRGIGAFEHATWWISEMEREGVGVPMIRRAQEAAQHADEAMVELLQSEIAVLQRCQPAPDQLADHVDLFPLPGVTPGTCGLLIVEPARGGRRPSGTGGVTLGGLLSVPGADFGDDDEDEDDGDDEVGLEEGTGRRTFEAGADAGRATLICGDAVATVEHLERGQVLHGAVDIETASDSFKEAVEIADVLVPGRDNWVINPLRRVM